MGTPALRYTLHIITTLFFRIASFSTNLLNPFTVQLLFPLSSIAATVLLQLKKYLVLSISYSVLNFLFGLRLFAWKALHRRDLTQILLPLVGSPVTVRFTLPRVVLPNWFSIFTYTCRPSLSLIPSFRLAHPPSHAKCSHRLRKCNFDKQIIGPTPETLFISWALTTCYTFTAGSIAN